jgi:predicted secreted protein
MAFTSIVAIYFLFFAFSAFVLLPFGVRTDDEAGTEKIAGQADSAPHRFDLKRHLLSYGWITPEDLDFYHPH